MFAHKYTHTHEYVIWAQVEMNVYWIQRKICKMPTHSLIFPVVFAPINILILNLYLTKITSKFYNLVSYIH